MAEYMTKQRKLLMDYLISHTDETLPTSRIVEALSDEGISPSAIYRNLSALEKKGKLFRSLTAVIRKGTTGAAVITETDDSIQNRLRSYKKNKM